MTFAVCLLAAQFFFFFSLQSLNESQHFSLLQNDFMCVFDLRVCVCEGVRGCVWAVTEGA